MSVGQFLRDAAVALPGALKGVKTGGGVAYKFGERWRRTARWARENNPADMAPMKAAAAWTTGEAVTIGTVRANANKLYIANSAGTCGATAPTHANNVQTSDGAVFWIYFGPAYPTTDAADAPTITFATGNPGLGHNWDPVTRPEVFRVYGATPAAYRTTMWKLNAFNALAATPQASHARVLCRTNALKFSVLYPANGFGGRVIIDNRYYELSHRDPGGSDVYCTFDFSTARRKTRSIVFEAGKSGAYFGRLQTTTADDVWAPGTTDDIRAVWISDSMCFGSSFHGLLGGHSIPNIWGQMLGVSDVWNMSTGGTGYIATNGGTAYTYGQRIADATNAAVIATADVVCLMGSTNDIGQSAGAITAAVTAAMQAIRTLNPTCVIIVYGLVPVNNAGVATTEAAVQAGFAAANDGRAFYIPLYGASPLPIVTGAWNNSADTNSVTAPLVISNGDNLHPIDLGIRTLAERLARETERFVLPYV